MCDFDAVVTFSPKLGRPNPFLDAQTTAAWRREMQNHALAHDVLRDVIYAKLVDRNW